MKNHSVSIRLSDEAYEKLLSLETSSGQNKSQTICSLIMESTPAEAVDHSREILPHLCKILSAVSESETDEADQIRQEVNDICQLLKK